MMLCWAILGERELGYDDHYLLVWRLCCLKLAQHAAKRLTLHKSNQMLYVLNLVVYIVLICNR
ncbi:hypothetical protein HanHA300_Chr09g0311141 [Helianthus annuus]|nr:hypothetical protein HanHA300_Chr09g0311141 [Helianthus annuus]KAJ0541738.1 hypothetical protein HanHA89_Chr09g0331941 [Helianthus annuus]KAJ0706813.1 hypothetical protein HanLR1_Chr09g0311381 [Helianthus annuus]